MLGQTGEWGPLGAGPRMYNKLPLFLGSAARRRQQESGEERGFYSGQCNNLSVVFLELTKYVSVASVWVVSKQFK